MPKLARRTRRVPAATVFALAACTVASLAIVSFAGPAGAASPPATAHLATTAAATSSTAAPGTFTGIGPARLLDTRASGHTVDHRDQGTGALAGGHTLTVPVAGRAGIPSDAEAVVLNLTQASATKSGYVTAYPAGTARPGTSNLDTIPGSVFAVDNTVQLGAGGAVTLYASAGSTNLVIDVTGYYEAGTSGSTYVPQTPVRVVDTRTVGRGPIPSGEYVTMYAWDDTADNAQDDTVAFAFNITVTGATESGYLRAWPGDDYGDGFYSSVLNFTAGQTVSNMAVVATEDDGLNGPTVSIGNFSSGSVQVIADVVGYYEPSAEGGDSFVPMTPTRIVDTRIDRGSGPLTAGQTSTVATTFGDSETQALVGELTGLGDPSSTYLTAFAGGTSLPGTSSLNLAARATRSNTIMPGLSATSSRSFALYNYAGTAQAVVDVVGYFEPTTE